ncbi:MAG: CocE/NonD family hydrolase [Bryobacterales bacterium]|nr:CocE/NonD family hydrolase [Bryobacterales bacterium]
MKPITILVFLPLLAAAQITEQHVMVPMRDGVRLSVYLYIPEGKGPWPVLYEQRYSDVTVESSKRNYRMLASKGYVVAAENFRGAQKSEGVYTGYRALSWGEQQDGYDTVAWLAKQPWSNGKVGTFGGSQAGYAQNFLAVTRPPALVAQYMTDTGQSLFHLGYRRGGTTRRMAFQEARDPKDAISLNHAIFNHGPYSDYWHIEDVTRMWDKMNVPCFTLGSWYDFMNVGSIESYIARQHKAGPNSKGKQKLLIGPWLHGSSYRHQGPVGDITYPPNSIFPVWDHMVRWFDHYLKGIDNGVDREPTVRYYVMGANQWREAQDWPVPAKNTPYYFHNTKTLNTTQPKAEAPTTYQSDPANPVPMPGRAFAGAKDSRETDQHKDARTFTTEPLTTPIEWTGLVKAELYVSSTAPDSDFIVRVSDVYPDGRSILIIDGIRRARFRDAWEKEVFMTPGQTYKVAFDVGWLSQVFEEGHRIRVTVASTGAPFYDPNPQTGGPVTYDPPAKGQVATQTLHHKGAQASKIIAPVHIAKLK